MAREDMKLQEKGQSGHLVSQRPPGLDPELLGPASRLLQMSCGILAKHFLPQVQWV